MMFCSFLGTEAGIMKSFWFHAVSFVESRMMFRHCRFGFRVTNSVQATLVHLTLPPRHRSVRKHAAHAPLSSKLDLVPPGDRLTMGSQLLCGTQGHCGTIHSGGLHQQSQPSQFQEAYQGGHTWNSSNAPKQMTGNVVFDHENNTHSSGQLVFWSKSQHISIFFGLHFLRLVPSFTSLKLFGLTWDNSIPKVSTFSFQGFWTSDPHYAHNWWVDRLHQKLALASIGERP